MTAYSMGMCRLHYVRVRRTGEPGQPAPLKTYAVPSCAIDGCAEPHRGHGYCSMHLVRNRRHGDPLIVLKPGFEQRDDVTYSSAHDRVRRARGSASSHRCVMCGQPATHWAYDHEDPNAKYGTDGASDGVLMPYSLDLDHYIPLCLPDHRVFDAEHGSRVLFGRGRR